MAGLGDPLKFRDDRQRAALGSELRDMIVQQESEHDTYFHDIDTHRDWRDAIPEVKERRTPWRGASNLVIPLIAIQADATVSRILLQMFSSERLWYGTSENEVWSQQSLDNAFRFLNYVRRKRDPGFFGASEAAIDEQQVLGHGIMQQLWAKEQRYVMPRGATKPVLTNLGAGAKLFHHRRECVVYPREGPIEEAPFVAVQKPMMWSQLVAQCQAPGSRWDRDAVERVRSQSGLMGITQELRAGARARAGLTEDTDPRFEPHDIREVWVDFPFLGMLSDQSDYEHITRIGSQDTDHFTVPIIVYLHMKSAEVLCATYSEYLLPRLPFYDIHRKRTTSRGDQYRGLAKDLEHLQRGGSTIVNQGIDAITFGNCFKIVTSDPKMLTREWVPNMPFLVSDMASWKEIAGAKVIVPEMQMLNFIMAMGERYGGQSDPSLGQESKMGGHPSPATNYIGMLQQSQILTTRSIKSIQNAFARIGEDRWLLFQQFEQNAGDWIQKVFGQSDGDDTWNSLTSDEPFTGQVSMEVHTLSELHNPDAEMRKAVMIDQLVTNYHVQLNQFMEILKPQNGASPEQTENARMLLENKARTMTKALEAADVDEIEDFIFKLKENQSGNLALLGQLPGLLASQAGGGAGAGAGPPGGPPFGTGPVGAVGVPGGVVQPVPVPARNVARVAARGGGSGFTG